MTKAQAAPGGAILPRRKALLVLFWFLALSLLFNFLFGDMGLIQVYRQRRAAVRLRQEVRTLKGENDRLTAEIHELRHDPYRIETIAREELGLSRPGEIIFLFQGSAQDGVPAVTPSPTGSPVP